MQEMEVLENKPMPAGSTLARDCLELIFELTVTLREGMSVPELEEVRPHIYFLLSNHCADTKVSPQTRYSLFVFSAG
jgi:hypothetical protein